LCHREARAGGAFLLITDDQMPRLSRLELIKRLRLAGHTLPVVVTSGSFDAGEAQRHDLAAGNIEETVHSRGIPGDCQSGIALDNRCSQPRRVLLPGAA